MEGLSGNQTKLQSAVMCGITTRKTGIDHFMEFPDRNSLEELSEFTSKVLFCYMCTVMEYKVKILREYETYCYQVIYYLVQNENQAVIATRQVLLLIYDNNSFFSMSDIMKRKEIRGIAIKRAIQVLTGKDS